MDSDATVARRGGATTARKPSRTARTESTAVFVGRASFQMIPARQKYGSGEEEGTAKPELRWGEVPDAEDARQEVVAALRAEARALRAESELRVAAAAAAASAAHRTPAPGPTVIVSSDAIEVDEIAPAAVSPRRGVVQQVRPQLDVTEPIDARARSRSAPRARRGGVSPRTIVLALVAGASITLSAQAVMQRPDAPAPAVTIAATPPQPALPAPIQIASAPPAPAPAVPTVVASTATAPERDLAIDLSPPAAAPRKRTRARLVTATATSAAPRSDRRTSTAWVDPFADPAPAKATRTSKTTKTSRKAWVDPFVD